VKRRDFRGQIGRDFNESTPYWPETTRAPEGSPNIVLVVLDDVGFAQLGCFGSDIDTPHIDSLARNGLRFTNFHTTALCSPTRACLLTGRNHHRNSMGRIVELATGFPGYSARIPRENGFLSETLVREGWATYAVGKWHLAPEDETHLAAPRHNWPLGRGFERFYGYMEGETHQFVPSLIADNHQIPPPATIDEGYHLTEDLVDQALGMVEDLRAVDDQKPFFLYFCPGACHAPHQAPPEWIERYRGAFDSGWDAWRDHTLARQLAGGVLPAGTELSPRPDWVKAWDDLSDDERRLCARFMEAFAGFLSHTDHHIGRVLDGLRRTGDLDRTIVVLVSDNGASSEGGPVGSVNDIRPWNVAPRTVAEALDRIEEIGGPLCHNNYPWGWTVAGNTPFRRWKRETHEGGVADPLIVHWPEGLSPELRGTTRTQYVHAVDIAPTLLDAVGVNVPDVLGGVAQSHLDGASVLGTFYDAASPELHRTQYYEMFGCRAIFHDGWKAVAYHPIQDTRQGFEDDQWELFHVAADPSECHDLASVHPDLLRKLVERWWIEAGRNNVLPLDNRPFSEFTLDRPPAVPARTVYEYRPDRPAVPEMVAVNVRNRNHVIRVDAVVAESGTEGMLMAQGSGLGGWAFYVFEGRLAYTHNFVGLEEQHIEANELVPSGLHELAYSFQKTGEHRGIGHLLVDGEEVGRGEIPRFTPMRFSLTGAGLSVGYSDGIPVSRRFPAPFHFTGAIERAVVEVDGAPFSDPEGEAHIAASRQ
jgi:arylsulfatase A-like enzyme